MTARAASALVAAAALSFIGGVILGEYEFTGATPIAIGLIFGLVVSELVVELGKHRSPLVALLAAVVVAGGLALAGWRAKLSVRPFPQGAWVAMAVGAAIAAWRGNRWLPLRRPGTETVGEGDAGGHRPA